MVLDLESAGQSFDYFTSKSSDQFFKVSYSLHLVNLNGTHSFKHRNRLRNLVVHSLVVHNSTSMRSLDH